MSDTPRTNAEAIDIDDVCDAYPYASGRFVYADFARELERELAAMTAERNDARSQMHKMAQHVDDTIHENEGLKLLVRYTAEAMDRAIEALKDARKELECWARNDCGHCTSADVVAKELAETIAELEHCAMQPIRWRWAYADAMLAEREKGGSN